MLEDLSIRYTIAVPVELSGSIPEFAPRSSALELIEIAEMVVRNVMAAITDLFKKANKTSLLAHCTSASPKAPVCFQAFAKKRQCEK
jgi:hypothetical protein